MVNINIVTVNDPAYTVDDNGAVHIVLKDTEIFEVAASIIGKNEARSQAKTVKIIGTVVPE